MPVVVGMRLRRQRLLEVLTKLASRILQSIDESEAVLSLEIVGDVRMRRLNRTFRHRDKTTDVPHSRREKARDRRQHCSEMW